jgi:hypothetical protein
MSARGRAGLFAWWLVLAWVPASTAGLVDMDAGDFPSGTFDSAELELGALKPAAQWSSETTPLPPRHDAGLAFDETRGRALVFGGRDHLGAVFGDTWVYEPGSGWAQKTPAAAPAARHGHGLVWAGDKFLLFGGFDAAGAALGDTWLYDPDADSWTAATVSTAPSPRGAFAMAYDAGRGRAVLIGGESGGALVTAFTWEFDVAAGSWSSLGLNPFPSARAGACMAYDRSSGKLVLFGGRTSLDAAQVLGDTWVYDPSVPGWEQRFPSGAPSARSEAAMLYDARHGKAALFGGRSGAAFLSDVLFYGEAQDAWLAFSEPGSPSGRYGHAMAYDTSARAGLTFGGRQDISSGLLRRYVLSASGTWTSAPLDAWDGAAAAAPQRWLSVAASSALPAGTSARLQLSASADGLSFDAFRGPDGSTSSFYAGGEPVWAGHAPLRYARARVILASADPPARPSVSSVRLSFNRAPHRPQAALPADGARTNEASPFFLWSAVSDADGDAVSYRLEVDDGPAFAAPEVAVGGLSATSFQSPALPSATWYWRVRGEDADLAGDWSDVFSVLVDTFTPPAAVADLAGTIGPVNGSASLFWTFPGDDKGAVDGGTTRVRFAAAPILSEGAWASAPEERTFPLSAAAGAAQATTVTGLADATTYFFALRTADELGNLSPLSTNSPAVFTNAPPTVAVLSPNGGEALTGPVTVSWSVQDPNPGDAVLATLSLSSAPGAPFQVIAAAAPGPSFVWDSRAAANGSAYRLRAEAADARGLASSDESDAAFRIDNVNEAPAVGWTSPWPPALFGDVTVTWSVTDPNLHDGHLASVHLSTGGPAYFPLALGLAATSYVFSTRAWPNRAGYRLRVSVSDSGSPALGGEALSPAFEIRNSSPPAAFRLLWPLEGDFPSVFDAEFRWEPAPDPEGGPVSYRLRWAPDPALIQGAEERAGLSAPAFAPALGSLSYDAPYYWKVVAADEHGNETESALGSFSLSRRRAVTPDRTLTVEALDGLTEDVHLFLQDARVHYGDTLERARQDARGEKLMKTVDYPAWRVGLRRLDGTETDAGGLVTSLSFRVESEPSLRGPSVIERRHLRPAALNPSLARWELLDAGGGEASPTALLRGPGVVSLVAAAAPGRLLAGVTNFPNPFAAGRESTRLRYVLTEDAGILVRIYTLTGDLVRVLRAPKGAPGGAGAAAGLSNELVWDGRNGRGELVANGVYLAEIRAEGASGAWEEVRRVGVLK